MSSVFPSVGKAQDIVQFSEADDMRTNESVIGVILVAVVGTFGELADRIHQETRTHNII